MKPEMIAFQICVQARQAVHLWGEPGIGKTMQTEAIAKAMEERLWPVILSIREPSDQGGLPVIVRHDDGKSSVWMAPPRWAKELSDEGHGQVHLDELNVSPPTTQNSALRVVNEGWAGDQKLPTETSFILCGNPPETNPGVYDLTPAMANRVVHLPWPLDPEDWCTGMLSGWKVQVVRLPRAWEEGIEAMNGLFVAFMRKRGHLLLQKPSDPMEAGKAYLRDPEEYLAHPITTPLPTRQDQTMATLDQVAATALKELPKRKPMIERYYSAWKVLGRILKKQGDIAIPACRVLATNMPREVERALPEEVEDILPMLEEAGIDFSQAV
jgi:hypothetical protein